ncbi:GbsR/MarR family transcriptional regulator, partial [Actinomadura yumaensis]
SAPPAVRPAALGAHGRDPEAVRRYVEEFAALMVRTGVPPMAARVLTGLFTADSGSLTAAELVRLLRVSPASVSKAVGYLEKLELVRRERGRRRERYVIDDDVWYRTWTTSARAHEELAESSARGVAILGAATPAGARLNGMGRFFARLGEDMSGGPSIAAGGDALTVMAALVHARAPLTADRLAGALGWSADRVAGALEDAARHPESLDPLTLRRSGVGAYEAVAVPGRLTAAQRDRLRRTAHPVDA